jgi:hypothetical protein
VAVKLTRPGQATAVGSLHHTRMEKEPDVVLFELASHEAAERLAWRLRRVWTTWTEPDGPAAWIVGIDLAAGAGDLARLLRQTSDWVAEAGLSSILLELDGRVYRLPPAGCQAAA